MMTKEAYYFSHDSNARQDPKVLEMISVYGPAGYGRYWMIVELLREQSNHTLNISGKYAFNALAMQLHCTQEEAKVFVLDCINEFKLFESDGELFWSNSLLRRMAMREEVSQKRKKAAEKRWGKKGVASTIEEKEDAKPMQMHSEVNANAMQGKEKKGKESKGKERESNKDTMPELPFGRIIDYLNRKSGKAYKASAEKTKTHIRARFADGFQAEDFKKVIDVKCEEWINTDQEKYIRPETLFGTKFEAYLNQKPKGANNNGLGGNSDAAYARSIGEDGKPVEYSFD